MARTAGVTVRTLHHRDSEVHCAVADTYLSDERFTAHYDGGAPGLAQYVHDAVKAAAGR